MSLHERVHNTLLTCSIDQLRKIDWCGVGDGGDGVDDVGRQDGGIAPTEGVSISAGKIVLIAGFWREEAQGGWSGSPWWMGTADSKKRTKATRCPHRVRAT